MSLVNKAFIKVTYQSWLKRLKKLDTNSIGIDAQSATTARNFNTFQVRVYTFWHQTEKSIKSSLTQVIEISEVASKK